MNMKSEKKYWLDDPRNVKKIVYSLYVVCALLLLADFTYHKHADFTYHKHAHFDIEGWWGFFGFFGLVACVALVLVAKVLRVILKREEDYYD